MQHQKARTRGPNIKPTQQLIRQCYIKLQEAASQGDVHAAGWLIQLDMLERQQPATGQGG